jgi:hypothetical protein
MQTSVRRTDQAKLLRRVKLVRRVNRLEITPHEAEAEAARCGLAPLNPDPDPKIFDPMREVRWSLPMALAWIVWRDPNRVREQWDKWRRQKFEWKRLKLPNSDKEECHRVPLTPNYGKCSDVAMDTLVRESAGQVPIVQPDAAKFELWKLFQQGKLDPDGINIQTGLREPIDPRQFRDLEIVSGPKGRDCLGVSLGRIVYQDVTVDRSGFLALFDGASSQFHAVPNRATAQSMPNNTQQPQSIAGGSCPTSIKQPEPWWPLNKAVALAMYGFDWDGTLLGVSDRPVTGLLKDAPNRDGIDGAPIWREFNRALSAAAFKGDVRFSRLVNGKGEDIDARHFMRTRDFRFPFNVILARADFGDRTEYLPSAPEPNFSDVFVERTSYTAWLDQTYPHLKLEFFEETKGPDARITLEAGDEKITRKPGPPSDLEAKQAVPSLEPNKRPKAGRKIGSGSLEQYDLPLVHEMRELLEINEVSGQSQAASIHNAAVAVAPKARNYGHCEVASIYRRLSDRFKGVYPDISGPFKSD